MTVIHIGLVLSVMCQLLSCAMGKMKMILPFVLDMVNVFLRMSAGVTKGGTEQNVIKRLVLARIYVVILLR